MKISRYLAVALQVNVSLAVNRLSRENMIGAGL